MSTVAKRPRSGSDVLRAIHEPYADIDPKAASLYVVLFSNGIVKVGLTAQSNTRIAQHYATAASFGLRVVREWVSWPHLGAKSNEMVLAGFAEEHSRGLVAGREYFRDGNFDRIVEFARTFEGAVHPVHGVFSNIGADKEPPYGVVDTERVLSLADISHLTGIDIDYLVDLVTANWRSTRPLSDPRF